jgi:hypothetical protein
MNMKVALRAAAAADNGGGAPVVNSVLAPVA